MTSTFRRWLPWLLIPFLSGSALAAGFFHYADPLQDMRLAYDQNSRDSKAAYFQGYVSGIAESTRNTVWCPTTQVDKDDVTRQVSKYIRAHPGSTGKTSTEIIRSALAENFPCPEHHG